MTFRTRGLWRAASSSAMVPTPADFSGKRMIASLFVAFVAGTAYARDKCTAIHFAPGHGDAHAAWTFTTKAQTYTFIVAQMMRSVTSEPYTVSLSLK